MRSFNLEKLAAEFGGEYVLGMKDLQTHACYMIYGILQPGERDRLVRPGEGHEEILCAVDGALTIHADSGEMTLERCHAVHITEDRSFHISNPSDLPVLYIMAGGHVRSHH